MADPATPAKRLRLSRNKKKTWRKLSRDVDNLLPEQTKQELVKRRSGGFYIDVNVSGERRRQSRQLQLEQQQQQHAKSATSIILAGLRSHQSLFPGHDSTADSVQSKQLKRYNERPLERRVKQLLLAEKKAADPVKKVTDAQPIQDPWAAAPSQLPSEDSELMQHYLRCTRQAPVKRRFHGSLGSAPACLVPKSGASYNPSLQEHQSLLASVADSELDKQRRADRLHRQLERHFPTTARAAAALNAAEADEMAAGLFAEVESDDHVSAAEDEGKDTTAGTAAAVKKPVSTEEAAKPAVHMSKKMESSSAQSSKVSSSSKHNAEVRRQKAAATEAKRRKRLSSQLGQLTALSRQADRELRTADRLREAKLARRRVKAAGTRRIGRQKFEEAEEEFKLAEELTPCLRQLRPEGDLFVDAVRSYQRRNVIEPSSRVSWRPKLPVKRFKKRGQETDASVITN